MAMGKIKSVTVRGITKLSRYYTVRTSGFVTQERILRACRNSETEGGLITDCGNGVYLCDIYRGQKCIISA